MKKTRVSLLTSLVTLLLCSSMFVGSTFAWFTDTVSSTGNKIQAGTLKVDLLLKGADGEYTSVGNNAEPVFNYDKWEPGYSDGSVFKIVNNGNLALKYTLQIIANGTLEDDSLADVIDVYFAESDTDITLLSSFSEAKASMKKVGTLADVINSTQAGGFAHGVLLPEESKRPTNSELPAKYADEVREGQTFAAVVLHMQEEAGNEYQGKSLGTTFDIRLLATQVEYEKDGFDSNLYDEQAEYPIIAEASYNPGQPTVLASYDGDNKQQAKAVIPAEAEVPTGTEKIVMEVNKTEKPKAIELEDDEKSLNVDISFYSVKEDGTRTQITDFGTDKYASVDLSTIIPDGYSLERVYNTHDLNNPTVFEKVDSKDLVTDGKFYYDPSTKTMYLASSKFSPFTFVTKLAELMVQLTNKSEPATYMTLGAFRDSVNVGEDYESYTVTVLKDLDYTNENWTPIGVGSSLYFMGTFDGNNHTISLKNDNCPYDDMGLFDVVVGWDYQAIVKNLTVDVNFVTPAGRQSWVGGLCAGTCGNVLIENCTVNGFIQSGATAGGIIGWGANCYGEQSGIINETDLKNCTNNATIKILANNKHWYIMGGIAAQTGAGTTKYDSCINNGKLLTDFTTDTNGYVYAGHMAGKGEYNTKYEIFIKNCSIGEDATLEGYGINGTSGEFDNYQGFEGWDNKTSAYTYSGQPNVHKQMIGAYFGTCHFDGDENVYTNEFPHGTSAD